MDFSLLDGLSNQAEGEAVAAPIGNYLVLAGAGSGKTSGFNPSHCVADWGGKCAGIQYSGCYLYQ